MNSNNCEQACVCARTLTLARGAHVCEASASLCVQGSDAFMAVSDLSTSTERRSQEGGREMER